jgi:hypothetical protein
MPCAHSPDCAEKIQSGSVVFTWMVYVGKLLVLTAMKPESKISDALVFVSLNGVHGAANELAVTVWFFGRISKVTVSPTFAVMLVGLKLSWELAPTVTQWSVELEMAVGSAEWLVDDEEGIISPKEKVMTESGTDVVGRSSVNVVASTVRVVGNGV